MEYNGTPDPIPGMRDECLRDMGVVSDACTRAGVQGSCTIGSGAASIRNFYYGLSADGLNTVKQVCQATGMWTDGG
jgi:hypothetical protein